MSKTRLELQELLERILGLKHVYFQPPENLKLEYDCFVYSLNRIDADKADNTNYKTRKNYTITHISKKYDEDFQNKMLNLPYCSFDRHYKYDGLYHTVYSLYF